jgi:outer membrane lipoprotein-sorting protein
MVVHAEYYNSSNELIKKLDASQHQVVDPKKNKWMALKVRIENVKNGRFTLLTFNDVKVNQPIPNSTFTQQNLAR